MQNIYKIASYLDGGSTWYVPLVKRWWLPIWLPVPCQGDYWSSPHLQISRALNDINKHSGKKFTFEELIDNK